MRLISDVTISINHHPLIFCSILQTLYGGRNGVMTEMTLYVESFKDGVKWRESWAEDFQTVYASWSDHPIPSSISLADMGLTRAALLTGKEVCSKEYREPFNSDFYNIVAMMNNGLFHLFESKDILPWSLLPVNSIRIKGKNETDCFMGTCSPLEKRFFNG